MFDFPDQRQRLYCCFVCGLTFKEYDKMAAHIIDAHEEGREYLVCPVNHCKCPVADLRVHMRSKHPYDKIPKDRQLRATVIYDVKQPGKRKKIPNFKNGYFVSEKNGGKQMHYRSGYEHTVYECLEKKGTVLKYEVEPVGITYYFKGKRHRYYPDLLVYKSDGKTEMWEIKPANQSASDLNIAKWEAAKHYCALRGWTFEVYNEQKIQLLKENKI